MAAAPKTEAHDHSQPKHGCAPTSRCRRSEANFPSHPEAGPGRRLNQRAVVKLASTRRNHRRPLFRKCRRRPPQVIKNLPMRWSAANARSVMRSFTPNQPHLALCGHLPAAILPRKSVTCQHFVARGGIFPAAPTGQTNRTGCHFRPIYDDGRPRSWSAIGKTCIGRQSWPLGSGNQPSSGVVAGPLRRPARSRAARGCPAPARCPSRLDRTRRPTRRPADHFATRARRSNRRRRRN